MAAKTTLNAKNLAALGPERLAQLLLDVTKGNAEAKRRLRLELAGEAGVEPIVAAVRKRLHTLASARGFVDWNRIKPLIADLKTQKEFIMGRIAEKDPAVAFDLIWEFLALTNPLYARVDDSSGRAQQVFHKALGDLPALTEIANPAPELVADKIIAGLPNDDWGYYAPLICRLAEYLGEEGIARIRTFMASPEGAALPGYTTQAVYSMISEVEGDVDAYIALQSDRQIHHPDVTAYIADKLVAAGRAPEALPYLDAADRSNPYTDTTVWEVARIDVLNALDRKDEAQELRWACYADGLYPGHLRAYLDALPDFEDVEAEDRALEIAKAHPNVHLALEFLIDWKALSTASDMVITRRFKIDGNHYQLLTPAANALDGKHPLAATILRREMIVFALEAGRSSRYRHAARHLLECESAAHVIEDFGDIPDHEKFLAQLKAEHPRKSSFWSAVEEN